MIIRSICPKVCLACSWSGLDLTDLTLAVFCKKRTKTVLRNWLYTSQTHLWLGKKALSKQNLKPLIQEAGVPCVPNFSSMSGSYTKYSPVSFILNTIDVLGSLSAAPATDRNDFPNLTVVSF